MKRIILVALLLHSISLFAKTNIIEERPFKVAFAGSIDSYTTLSLLPSVIYRPIHYFDVSVGLRLTDFIGDKDHYNIVGQNNSSDFWKLYNPSNFIYHFAFQPGIKVYSPDIRIDDVDDRLFFTVGVGVIKPFIHKAKGYVEYFPNKGEYVTVVSREKIENHGTDNSWYSFAETAVNLTNDRWVLSLGYRLTNYDVYGSARSLYIQGQKVNFEKNKNNNELFVSFSYSL